MCLNAKHTVQKTVDFFLVVILKKNLIQ